MTSDDVSVDVGMWVCINNWTGIVVAMLADKRFLPPYPLPEWSSLVSGVMIESRYYGLIHFPDLEGLAIEVLGAYEPGPNGLARRSEDRIRVLQSEHDRARGSQRKIIKEKLTSERRLLRFWKSHSGYEKHDTSKPYL